MIIREKNGIKLEMDRNLNGDCVFTVRGRGIEKLRWYGYQNEMYAHKYFEKCVKEKK